MKKTLIIALLASSYLSATTLKKISEGPKGTYLKQETEEIQKYEAPKKLKLKKYKVKYDRGLEMYSIIPHDKKAFKKYMAENEIEKFTLKRIFGTAKDTMSIAISAYGYDWIYHRPDLAENFYRLEKEAVGLSLVEKIHIADYYLRTGRPENISTIIKKTDCMASFKNNSTCFYYLGIENYLLTGNHKNTYLRLCKEKIKKAKKIFNKK